MEYQASSTIHQAIAEFSRQLRALYGDRLVELSLFGSRARGDAGPDSDIDLLVVLRGEVEPEREISRTGGVAADVSLKYDVTLSCVFVSVERLKDEHNPFLRNVRRERVPIAY